MKPSIFLAISMIALIGALTACTEPTPSATSAAVALKSDVSDMAITRDGNTWAMSWTSESSAPVSVYMAGQPNLNIAEMQLVESGVVGSRLETTIPDSISRPYFAIVSENGARQDVAERLLPLEGGRNFRDLGGYPAADGKYTKWGMMYRSGVLAELTDTDYDYLSALDIAVICDFRASEERTMETTNWRGGSAPQIVSWDMRV